MPSASEVGNLFSAIPPALWGFLIGSLSSLAGVVLSNRASARRLAAQFAHERSIRTAESDILLRKEIHLDAIEAINAGMLAIGKINDLDVPISKVNDDYNKKGPSIAKARLIGNTNTIANIDNLMVALSSSFLRLSMKRLAAEAISSQIQSLQQRLKRFEDERDRMLQLMRQYNIEGEDNPARWETLDSNFEFEQSRIDESLTELDDLNHKLAMTRLGLAEQSAEETVRLGRDFVPLAMAIRTELRIPTDNDFEERSRETNDQIADNLTNFIEELRAMINAGFNGSENTDTKKSGL